MDASKEVVVLDPEEGPAEQLQILRQLLKSPGWDLLVKHANEQVKTRTDEVILRPLESTGKVTLQEYMKGEVGGIRLIMALPETLIEIAEAVIIERRKREENESEETSGAAVQKAP